MNIFGIGKAKCPHCGTQLEKDYSFCPQCGKPTGTGQRTCPHCGAPVSGDATFCPACGKQLSGAVAPAMSGHRWAKSPDDFAARIEVDDVPGFFRKELIVEAGTRAILLVDGRNEAGELPPGPYTMDTAFSHVPLLGHAKTVTAILVDVGDVVLEFPISGLYTSDPLAMTLDCRLVTRINNAVLFLVNMMKGQRTVSRSMLAEYLKPEIENAAAEAVARHSVAELSSNLAIKDELATFIEAHLRETFKSLGLTFERVSTLNFRHERWDAVRKVKEDYFVQITREEADLSGRKRLADVLNEREIQAIAEETAKVEQYERRAAVWARMRAAVLSDRMDEIRSEDQLEAFLRQQDRARLISDKEFEDLKRSFAEEREDHELQRRYLVRKLEIERQKELDRMELEGENELLELRLKRREMELRAQINEERIQTLERKKTEIEARQIELQHRLTEAKTQAEIDAIEREQDWLDVQLGVRALELMDARKLKVQREEMLIEAERDERALERRLREEAEQHRQNMERIRALAGAPAEVVIAESDPQRAQLIVNLRQMEIRKGMSAEQILAEAAERSPEAARALATLRSLPAEQQTALLERVLEVTKASKDEQTKILLDAIQTIERMHREAMASQRDTATAFARDRSAPTVIVTPGGAQTVSGGEGGGGQGPTRVVVCRKCGVESPVGTKYCKNCGEKFFNEA